MKVVDEDWLELFGATADQWQYRTAPDHGSEPAEEMIILAVCQAGPDNRYLRENLSNGAFAFSLCPV